MEPTEFEKWCAGELGYSPEYMMTQRKENIFGGTEYRHGEIAKRYRAYTAGVTSMLPYQTPSLPQPPEAPESVLLDWQSTAAVRRLHLRVGTAEFW